MFYFQAFFAFLYPSVYIFARNARRKVHRPFLHFYVIANKSWEFETIQRLQLPFLPVRSLSEIWHLEGPSHVNQTMTDISPGNHPSAFLHRKSCDLVPIFVAQGIVKKTLLVQKQHFDCILRSYKPINITDVEGWKEGCNGFVVFSESARVGPLAWPSPC